MSTSRDSLWEVDPTWLNQRESRAWRGYQRMRTELNARLARQLMADSGLSEADYAVLVVLSEAVDHRLRWGDLCRALDWGPSRLSHQISRMQERGTVERTRCDDDGRGWNVALTGMGLQVIEEAAPLHAAAVRHCFAEVLTHKQLDALTEISSAIIGHLAAEHNQLPADSP
jgi:DNA-binding MarR family transcriptional regulator